VEALERSSVFSETDTTSSAGIAVPSTPRRRNQVSIVDEWNPVLLRERVRQQDLELKESKQLVKLALDELRSERSGGSWEDTVVQLMNFLERKAPELLGIRT
jgi:hypothetical protein